MTTRRDVLNLESVFRDIAAWRAQALMCSNTPGIAELALRHRLPSAFLDAENVVEGGLLSYGPADAERTSLVNRSVSMWIESCAVNVQAISRWSGPAGTNW